MIPNKQEAPPRAFTREKKSTVEKILTWLQREGAPRAFTRKNRKDTPISTMGARQSVCAVAVLTGSPLRNKQVQEFGKRTNLAVQATVLAEL